MSPARNLVPRPLFRVGDSEGSPWTGSGLNVDDRADSPTGSRLAWNTSVNDGLLFVPLGFTYEVDATYYVAGSIWVGSGAFSYEAWVSPGKTLLTPQTGRATLQAVAPGQATYRDLSGVITAPALDRFTDVHGGPGNVSPNEEAHLVLQPKQANGAFAFLRLDYGDGTEHPGYFDGDTPDTSEWLYVWDGTARTSTSTATPATEPEPDPETTTTSLTVSPASITEGESSTLTATITPASATGTATFTIGADSIPVTVSSGVAATQVTITEVGEYEVAVTFSPVSEDDFLPSSGTASLTVLADPDPDPDPTPDDPWDDWDELATRLAPRVAAYVGRAGDVDTIATAEAQIPIVTEYVRGYTRGRGFADEIPAGPLRAVIVSGVARLATNPEQVSVFTTGDYSERPAQLAGWTLTELGVLHRYRRTSA